MHYLDVFVIYVEVNTWKRKRSSSVQKLTPIADHIVIKRFSSLQRTLQCHIQRDYLSEMKDSPRTVSRAFFLDFFFLRRLYFFLFENTRELFNLSSLDWQKMRAIEIRKGSKHAYNSIHFPERLIFFKFWVTQNFGTTYSQIARYIVMWVLLEDVVEIFKEKIDYLQTSRWFFALRWIKHCTLKTLGLSKCLLGGLRFFLTTLVWVGRGVKQLITWSDEVVW